MAGRVAPILYKAFIVPVSVKLLQTRVMWLIPGYLSEKR